MELCTKSGGKHLWLILYLCHFTNFVLLLFVGMTWIITETKRNRQVLKKLPIRDSVKNMLKFCIAFYHILTWSVTSLKKSNYFFMLLHVTLKACYLEMFWLNQINSIILKPIYLFLKYCNLNHQKYFVFSSKTGGRSLCLKNAFNSLYFFWQMEGCRDMI